MDLAEGSCGVCIGGSDDSTWGEFRATSMPKARKPYKCCECRETIPKGQLYERTVGKWDGDFSVYKTCLACADVRMTLCCDGWTYGQLWEDAQESFPYLTTGCLAQLTTAAAKVKLLEQWRAWKGL